MRRANHLIRKNQKGAPGKSSPSVVALINPRPQLKSLTTLISIKQNPRSNSRVFALPISNGASPIASALGIRLGATPREHIHLNNQLRQHPAKQDISTLLGLGHFYFALTAAGFGRPATDRRRPRPDRLHRTPSRSGSSSRSGLFAQAVDALGRIDCARSGPCPPTRRTEAAVGDKSGS